MAENTFDVILSQFTLEHLEDWTTPASELRRVLAPEGRVVVAINHPFQEYLLTKHGILPDYEAIFDIDEEPTVVRS